MALALDVGFDLKLDDGFERAVFQSDLVRDFLPRIDCFYRIVLADLDPVFAQQLTLKTPRNRFVVVQANAMDIEGLSPDEGASGGGHLQCERCPRGISIPWALPRPPCIQHNRVTSTVELVCEVSRRTSTFPCQVTGRNLIEPLSSRFHWSWIARSPGVDLLHSVFDSPKHGRLDDLSQKPRENRGDICTPSGRTWVLCHGAWRGIRNIACLQGIRGSPGNGLSLRQ